MNKINEIVVLSGKGGTGKTTLTLALTKKFKNKVTADTDVDAADMFIIMDPDIKTKKVFKGMNIAEINTSKCTNCGVCISLCRFDAISVVNSQTVIDPVACDACTLCAIACPEKAISMIPQDVGTWYISDTKEGEFVHAELKPGGENSGNLVSMVKQQAKITAENNNNKYIIIDGPPGIGCPVTSSLSGSDMAVFVTEPSLSALHDLKRIESLTKHFKIKIAVVINRYNINSDITLRIEEYCKEKNINILGKISFNKCIKDSINKKLFPYTKCSDFAAEIDSIYLEIMEEIVNA